MGAISYLHNIEPTHQLLALAVFVDPLKSEHVRSIHVHEQNVGSVYVAQQEFWFNPGHYMRVGEPVSSVVTGGAGTKQIVDAMLNMHHLEGWQCALDYRRHSPSDTFMTPLLTPSRNGDLKSVPSLEQDLKLVENTLMSSSRSTHIMLNSDETLPYRGPPCGDGKTTHTEDYGWLPTGLKLSCQLKPTLLGHTNDCIPGLETPERTPHGQPLDVWQNWGSELELASPEITLTRSSQSVQVALSSSGPTSSQNAGYGGTLWNPVALLDLNLESTEFLSQEKDVDCSLVLSSPVAKSTSCLNLQLGMPSLSLQHSAITEDSMDCFTLECFGDSVSSYNNMAVEPITAKAAEASMSQSTHSMCSEESVGCDGCVINMSPWDVKSMTSANMHSAALKESAGCMSDTNMLKKYSAAPMKNAGNDKAVWSSLNCKTSAAYLNVNMLEDYPATSITSNDIHSATFEKHLGCWNGDKGSPSTSSEHRKESSARASCSSISTQSVQQGLSQQADTGNKPCIIRSSTSSDRLPEITLQELSHYFSMPITQASKELKVGLTVLKKRCRQFGIPRWPHRKMKSIDSLIYNIQDLAEDQGAKSSSRVQNAVKELEEQKRLMEEMPGVDLAERTKKLRQACFKANYKKRKLGMAIASGSCTPPSPFPFSVAHSFNILKPSTLVVPFARNPHTMDHFL